MLAFPAEAWRNQILLCEMEISFNQTQLFPSKDGKRYEEGEKIFQDTFRGISKGLKVIRKIF